MKRRLKYYEAYVKRQKKSADEAVGHLSAESVRDVMNDFYEYTHELTAEIRRLQEKCGEDPNARKIPKR